MVVGCHGRNVRLVVVDSRFILNFTKTKVNFTQIVYLWHRIFI